MSAHTRNLSTVSDGGSESSLTSFKSSSDPEPPSQPRVPPPPAQPAHARNPSLISKTGSESSLSSLSSSGSERLEGPQGPRPQTPNTRNATDVPGLTLSPSTAASSPESTRSYGFSGLEEYSALGNVVQEIIDSMAAEHSVQNLYVQAQKHLTIFDNPLYSSLDTPEWVRRVSEHSALQDMFQRFTVRRLFKSMYDTAEDLKLKHGKRYVMAAICACAIKAREADQKELELAQHLQRLASTWAAFLLWPFFAQQRNTILSVEDVSSCATPTWTETAVLMDGGLSENRKGTLRDKVLRRDGYRCVLSGTLEESRYLALKTSSQPFEAQRAEELEACHIFKRSVAVYSGSSANTNDKDKFRSVGVTFELLRHYCELNPKYLESMESMDMPENAMLLCTHFHKTFDKFLWCLKPTKTPNCYEVKEYDPVRTFMHTFPVPSHITFKDHTVEDPDKAAPQAGPPADSEPDATGRNLRSLKRSHGAMSAGLPDPELLRLHAALTGVLRMSGAAGVFELIMERRGPGNPPVPSADGEAFIKEVVDPEMQELRESVAVLWPTIS